MSSLNRVQLIGHLGRDPEIRSFDNGGMVANATLATTERWKDKQTGETREATEWHRLVFNGKLAEIVSTYLQKGALIYAEGSLRTRKWTDNHGIEKYSTEVRVDEMRMLGGRNDRDATPEGGDTQSSTGNSLNQSGFLDTFKNSKVLEATPGNLDNPLGSICQFRATRTCASDPRNRKLMDPFVWPVLYMATQAL